MISIVIVDDESNARNVLKKLIQEVYPDSTLIGVSGSVEDAYKLIKKENPQLVFLDVEMLDGTGFDLLEKFIKIDFEVIFTTAYNHYAVKAFKYNAIDYLLKPIDIEELEKALCKIEDKLRNDILIPNKVKELLESIKAKSKKKIAINSSNKIEFVDIDDIICCSADGIYTEIITFSKKIISSKPLKHFNGKLQDYTHFFRISKSHLINLNHIISFQKDSSKIELINDVKVEVSRRKKKDFIEVLKTL